MRNREPHIDWNDRLSLIAWLIWNDANGTYGDVDSAAEGFPPLTLNDATELVRDICAREVYTPLAA